MKRISTFINVALKTDLWHNEMKTFTSHRTARHRRRQFVLVRLQPHGQTDIISPAPSCFTSAGCSKCVCRPVGLFVLHGTALFVLHVFYFCFFLILDDVKNPRRALKSRFSAAWMCLTSAHVCRVFITVELQSWTCSQRPCLRQSKLTSGSAASM